MSGCSHCGFFPCYCYNPAERRRREEKLKGVQPVRTIRPTDPATGLPDFGTEGLGDRIGLVVEGVATTPDPVHDYPLPSGLKTLSGRTTHTFVTKSEHAQFSLPLPLRWWHGNESTNIGEVVAVDVTPERIAFRAVIPMPGSARAVGLDAELLSKAWTKVEDGSARSVSVMRQSYYGPDAYRNPDRWNWTELSVVDTGQGAHPKAQIHRVFRWGVPAVAGKAADTESPVMRYRGVWREGMTCKAGDVATTRGLLWYATGETTQKPGEGSSPWRMMHKSDV